MLNVVRETIPGKDSRFRCPASKCCSTFTKKSSLYHHYRSRHLGVLHTCPGCEQNFATNSLLRMHNSKCMKHGEESPKFDDEGKQAEMKMIPKPIEHQMITQKNGHFLCPFKNCTYSYLTLQSVIEHYKVIHMGHRDVCQKCNIKLRKIDSHHTAKCKGSEEALLNHVGALPPKKDGLYHCPVGRCHSVFTSSDNCLTHFRSHHIGKQVGTRLNTFLKKSSERMYSCSKCKVKFNHLSALQIHEAKQYCSQEIVIRLAAVKQVMPGKDGRLSCPHENCHTSSTSKQELVAHYKRAHVGSRYTCSKCNCQMMTSHSLELHQRKCQGRRSNGFEPIRKVTLSADGRFYCPYDSCSSSCTTKSDLRTHYKVYHLGFRYRCPKCDREFMGHQGLDHHKTRCNGRREEDLELINQVQPAKDGLFHCPYEKCSFSYVSKSNLVVHHNEEHLGLKQKCAKCQSYFKYSSNRISHEALCKGRGVQDPNPAQQVTPRKDGRFYCPHKACSHSSTTKNGLVAHYRTEHLGRRYLCQKCGYGLKSLNSLRMHKTRCKGEIEKELKPVRQVTPGGNGRYNCPYESCSHSSSMKNGLIFHYKQKHLGFRYSCPNCTAKFNYLQDLKNHKCIGKATTIVKPREHKVDDQNSVPDKDKRFQCPFETCGSSYNSNKTLEIHCKAVHQDVKRSCPKCALRFTQKVTLTNHMLRCIGSYKSLSKNDMERLSEGNIQETADEIAHGLEVVTQMAKEKDGCYHCPKENCNKSYTKRHTLVEHYKTSHLGVRYSCPKCKLKYSCKRFRNIHVKKCDGTRPEEGYWFKKTKCVREMEVGKDGFYHCPFKNCSNSHTSRGNLCVHYKVKHLGFRFECSKCPTQFTRKSSLDNHEATCAGNCQGGESSRTFLIQFSEPTCAYVSCAHMHCFLSVSLAVCD